MLEQLLVDKAHRELANVIAAVLRRHFERPEAGLAALALQSVADFDVELALEEELLFKRHQFLLAELADAGDHHAMLFGNREIHRAPLIKRGCRILSAARAFWQEELP